MSNKKLEKRLGELKDWFPIGGAVYLSRKFLKLPDEIRESEKVSLYMGFNAIYNLAWILLPYYLVLNKI